MINDKIFTKLSNDPGVKALVSSRIYPITLPMDCTTPAISYQTNGAPKNNVLPVYVLKYRFMCWSENPDTSNQVAHAIRACLDGWSMSGSPEIESTWYNDLRDIPPDDSGLYQTMVDVYFRVKE